MRTVKNTTTYHTNACCLLPAEIREALALRLRNDDLSLRTAVVWLKDRGYSISKSAIGRWCQDGYPGPPNLTPKPTTTTEPVPKHLIPSTLRLLARGYSSTTIATLLTEQGYPTSFKDVDVWARKQRLPDADDMRQLELPV